ncbi:SDR family NAD(P)-dependent oxidoreductase [Roseovarius aestuarii]|nr:SDR family NAD(P)-dependent oxidoreductase [Roseovarius aestuarii]
MENESRLKAASDAIRKLQNRVRELERGAPEPIAVIGLGCRFPGAESGPDAFWQMLKDGRHGVRRVPADRWDADAWYDPDPTVPGKTHSRHGGFIDDVTGFDAALFGLSPREADALDPQQRLFLELAWESLENAGIPPQGLAGSATGVFAGISTADYSGLGLWNGDLTRIDPYSYSGSSFNALAGRVSYILGLEGPSMAVDTACSSSLVTVHLAAQALRAGECDLALAGGVNVMLSPEMSVFFTKLGAITADDKCKAFDARADGYVRGEGGGIVALKRLSDARRDGDHIHCVIQGSAVNQDGHSNGFTAPNGLAQQAVVRRALQVADVDASMIGYIECHGTGTFLGDPIEVGGLGRVFGGSGFDVLIGSVKTNLGHLEAAAGIAGLIKCVLALEHGFIPASLHFERPNPRIDWSGLGVRVVDRGCAWPDRGGARHAGVSAFGMSGTNAHVVLGSAPEVDAPASVGDPGGGARVLLWPVSGRDSGGLSQTAGRHLSWARAAVLEAGDDVLRDGARSAALGRSGLEMRGVAVGDGLLGLDGLARGEAGDFSVTGQARGRGGCVFLFPGQGAQFAGMGLDLMRAEPEFGAVIEECAAHMGGGLVDALGDEARLGRTEWTQPALFAVSLGLSRLLRGLGVRAQAYMGHSVGEYVAAVESGIIGLGDGARLVAARGRLMGALPGGGAMGAARCDAAQLADLGVELAADNGPGAISFSGPEAAVLAAIAALRARGISARRLAVSHGFHSSLMEPCLGAFEEALSGVEFGAPQVGVISNLTGDWYQGAPDGAYFAAHLRAPVQFGAGLARLYEAGYRRFVEVGPGRGLAAGFGADLRAISLLTADRSGPEGLARGLAEIWCDGGSVDWAAWQGPGARPRLPGYAFQRQRHWLKGAEAGVPARAGAGGVPVHRVVWHRADMAEDSDTDGGDVRLFEASSDVAGDLVRLGALLGGGDGGRIVVLTRGARRVTGGDVSASGAVQAGLWGFGRTAALEHPQRWGGLVDLDPEGDDAGLPTALATLARGAGEVALRAGHVYHPRLEPMAVPVARHPPVRAGAAYLVTGGSGALGRRVALSLLAAGAGRVVITGRRALDKDLPAGLEYHRVEDAAALGALVASVAPVGVVHAAGSGGFADSAATTADLVARTFAGKVDGALALHAALGDRQLDWLVFYGSISGVWGSRGQAVYGAANQVLEGLAEHRRSQGLAGLCVNWGPFAGGGMTDAAAAAQLGAMGLGALDPEQGQWLLNGLLEGVSGTAAPVAADVDWARFCAVYEARGPRALLDRVRPAAVARAPSPAVPGQALRPEAAVELVRGVVADVLGFAGPGDVPVARGLFELGLDSLMAVEVARRLGASLGRDVAATLVFDGGSAQGIAARLCPDQDAAQPRVQSPALATPGARGAIAIVGLSCRFPGGADADSYFSALLAGRDSIRLPEAARWPRATFVDDAPDGAARPGTMRTERGGYIDLPQGFDCALFGISPREAARLDPQHRLVLEVAWEALERSGIAPDGLRASRTGVYLGISNGDYGRLLEAEEGAAGLGLHHATGNALSAASGRLAHFLGLRGPSLSIDTACSSSLVAVHLARRALQGGEADLMLAGGVNMLLSPLVSVAASQAGMLSPDGLCKTFDARADGYVRGEGCGIVVLKRLEDARAAGDDILAVLAGSAVNHNGPGAGLTVPSGAAQEALIAQALDEAGLAGHDIDVLEAHGTGTSLGDPIELGAAARVLCGARGDQDGAPLIVGSVKTNIGHLESAAGVAGLIKMVQALEHGHLPGQLHFQKPNPHIAWDGIEVATAPRPWTQPLRGGQRRAAGISSFGFTGTNAHLVLTEAPAVPVEDAAPDPTSDPAPWPVVVSGQTPEALAQNCTALADWFDHLQADPETDPDAEAAALCRVLIEGRASLAHRAGFVAEDARAVGAGLRALAQGVASDDASTPGVDGTVWLFTGQGSQWAGMGRALYGRATAFSQIVDRCEAVLAGLDGPWDRPLREVMFGGDDALLAQTHWTQPALYTLQCALAGELRAWDQNPRAVAGHSIGEYAAAHVAGVLSLEAGLTLVAARGRLMGDLPRDGDQKGAMVAVAAGRDTVTPHLVAGCEIGAVNGADAITLSGAADAVAQTAAALGAAGIRCTPLAVSHGFHSAQMDPMLDPFAAVLQSVDMAAPRVPLIRGLDGTVQHTAPTPEDWSDAIRQPVRFDLVIERLTATPELASCAWLELGPHPALIAMASTTHSDHPTLPTLRKNQNCAKSIAQTAVTLHKLNLKPKNVIKTKKQNKTKPPTYKFTKEKIWLPKTHAWEKLDTHASEAQGAPIFHDLIWAPARSKVAPFVQFDHLTPDDDQEAGDLAAFVDRLDVATMAALAALPKVEASPDMARLAARLTQIARPGAADFDALIRERPDFAPEIALLQKSLAALPAVLRGERSGVDVLFGASGEMQALYHTAPLARRFNALMARVAQDLARDWPRGRPLRVLEIGAGSGGTTKPLRAAMPGSEYMFTDISAAFLQSAATQFGVDTAVLDITRAPGPQGFAEGGYDMVVAANVLHAVPDLRAAVANAASLLAPHGVLLLLEVTERRARFDAVFGLTPGWWAFGDSDLRPDHPLIDAATWQQVLEGEGFAETKVISDPKRHGLPDQSVIVARKGASLAQGRVIDAGLGASDDLLARATDLSGQVLDALNQSREKLWLVTRGAIATAPGEECPDPGAAALWGVGRTLRREHPDRFGGLIDLDPALDPAVQRAAIDEWRATGREDQVAYRAGAWIAPRMTPQPLLPKGAPLRLSGEWLITGGLGGLGLAVARRLAERGARRILLVSRRGELNPAVRAAILAAGAQIEVHHLDCANGAAMGELFDANAPFEGVIHAAGQLDDGVLSALTCARFETVLRAKVAGAEILDALTRRHGVEHFVLFSSAVAVLAPAGQANHAAANAVLESIAAARMAAGHPALAIHWGAWSHIGAAAHSVEGAAQAQGFDPIQPEQGLNALETAMTLRLAAPLILPADWDQYLTAHPADRESSLFPRSAQVQDVIKQSSVVEPVSLPERLARVPANRHSSEVRKAIRAAVGDVFGFDDPNRIDVDAPLGALGMDSLMSLQLRNRLAAMSGIDLPAQVLFDHPTVADLADLVLAQLVPQQTVDVVASAPDLSPPDLDDLDALSDEEAAALLARLASDEERNDPHE